MTDHRLEERRSAGNTEGSFNERRAGTEINLFSSNFGLTQAKTTGAILNLAVRWRFPV